MVWVSEEGQCSRWRLLPLMVLEILLVLIISWRVVHQVRWKSHPRRVFFHLVLLVSCAFRCVFWLSLCSISLLAVGQALMWWSNSLILLCTASIILQWSSAVDAGRVAVRTVQRVKGLSLHLLLVFLHAVHLGCSFGIGVHVMSRHGHINQYITKTGSLLPYYRGVDALTVFVDSVAVSLVARKLQRRLLSAAMSEEMKRKSVIQMLLLVLAITIALTMEMIVDLPVLVYGIEIAWGQLRYADFCIIKYFIPGELLSLSFLYIMRRVEQREPVRMVVMPTAASLVEFEECSGGPCMWCQHHRRYHGGRNKWNMTYLTAETSEFSPNSAHASFRSIVSSAHGTGMTANMLSDVEPPVAGDDWLTSLSDRCSYAMALDRHSRGHEMRLRLQRNSNHDPALVL